MHSRLEEPVHQQAWYWHPKPQYSVSSIRRVKSACIKGFCGKQRCVLGVVCLLKHVCTRKYVDILRWEFRVSWLHEIKKGLIVCKTNETIREWIHPRSIYLNMCCITYMLVCFFFYIQLIFSLYTHSPTFCVLISRPLVIVGICRGILYTSMCPANTLRNNDVVITSKRRHFDVITSKWRRFDVITTLLLRYVFRGCLQGRCCMYEATKSSIRWRNCLRVRAGF